jgi:hypothetical protein
LLLEERLEAFRRDGFVVARGLYRPDEVDAIARWLDDLASRPLEAGKLMVYFEGSLKVAGQRIISRIEKFVDYHAGLAGLVVEDRLTKPLGDLMGGAPVLFKEKVNFKLPGGGGFEPHQDIQPGWDEYAPYFLTALVAIDPSTADNGCLELAAGCHTRGLIGRKWEPLRGPELDGLEFVDCPLDPGDVVFFDCFVPHQSKPNLTDLPRRNLYLTYNRRSDGDHRRRYFADKRAGYPPDFEREPGRTYSYRV